MGLLDRLKTKITLWFTEPLGAIPVQDPPETDLKPAGPVKISRPQPERTRGRGDKKKVLPRIDEFHPRGAAGRREVRGPQAPHKAALPHHGNRPKYPK